MSDVGGWEPRLLAFVCNWANYTPAERADLEQAMAGGRDRLVRISCAGGLSPQLLLSAVQEGYDGILVVGCQADACHYREGSQLARARLEALCQFLAYLGLEPGRIRLFWQSAIPGRPCSELLSEVRAAARALGPASRLVRSPEP